MGYPLAPVLPKTPDGLRCLARIGLEFGDVDFLNEIERRYIEISRMTPDVPMDEDEKAAPLCVERTSHGLVIAWNITRGGECAACEGTGTLTARGADLEEYDVFCPKCDGCGEDEDSQSRTAYTDIDGQPLQEAA